MMPTCKHIDISTVLQSNMNGELDKGHTWLSKKTFTNYHPVQRKLFGVGGGGEGGRGRGRWGWFFYF